MGDDKTSLTAAIDRLVRRARAARRVRWSGRVLLVAALGLLALFVGRVLLRTYYADEAPDVAPLVLVAVGAVFVAMALGVLELALRLTNPDRLRVARLLDRRGRLRDLVTAGLTAVRLDGPIPAEVARRAARSVSDVEPAAVYPVRRSGAKLLAVLPLLIVAFYLLGLPPDGGPIPLIAEGGELPGGQTPSAGEEEGTDPETESETLTPDGEPGEEEGPLPQAGPPDEVRVRIIPAKKKYKADEPILLFVLANPGEHMASPHDLAVALALNGEIYETEHEIHVEPGEGGKAVISIDGKKVEKMAEKLKPGKHRVAALLAEGELAAVSDEAEFEIEPQDDGGGGGPPPPPEPEEQPEPEPEPEPDPEDGGEQEPPPMDVEDRLVDPFVGEGDVEKKKGIALVPDENAPAGAPPRRLSLPEAAAEAGRRGGTGVPTERIRGKDRDLVTKYFELLKDADAKKKPK